MPNNNTLLFFIIAAFHILIFILNIDIFLFNSVTRSRTTSVESVKDDIPKGKSRSKKIKNGK